MATVAQDAAKPPKTIVSFNPATGDRLGEVAVTPPEAVAEAARRAREAQAGWQALGAAGRGRILLGLRQAMIDRADEIAETVSRENGKPPGDALAMTLPICEAVRFYAKIARRAEKGRRVSPTALFLGARARIYYEPKGVVGFIMPWNFPFNLGGLHMIPALAAGNAVIQKPSEHNPLIGELLLSLFRDAGVPEGVVQMVHGYADVGEALIDNVDAICFVGSPETGRRIMERAARRLIPVVLELGGKDAAIVRRDADLDRAARGIVSGACYNAGQTCNAIERVYAHDAIAAPLAEKIVAQVGRLRQGGDEPYDVGPIKWAPQREVYERHLADAAGKGARVLCGGAAVERGGGTFWPPTVLTGATHAMEIMREETFGPFIPIMTFRSDEEAVELANDSPYGLGASVWTEDIEAGERMARRLKAGSVVVNNAVVQAGCVTLPFGGDGRSGVGRTMGEAGFFNYVSPKSVLTMPKNRTAELGWMPYADDAKATMLSLMKMLYSTRLNERIAGLWGFLRKLRDG